MSSVFISPAVAKKIKAAVDSCVRSSDDFASNVF